MNQTNLSVESFTILTNISLHTTLAIILGTAIVNLIVISLG